MRVRHPLLVAAAGASVAASALADVLERGSHFSHLVALALVAAVVVVAHAGLTGSVRGTLPTIAVALVAQPALHLWAESVDPAHTRGLGLAHMMANGGSITAMQVLTSALAVLIAGTCARIADVLGRVIRRPVGAPAPPVPDRAVSAPAPQPPIALQSCCWAVRTARRGPPVERGSATPVGTHTLEDTHVSAHPCPSLPRHRRPRLHRPPPARPARRTGRRGARHHPIGHTAR
jgi:hypothetical protein